MLKLSQFYRVNFVLICFLMQCQLIVSTHHGNIVKRMDMDIATCLGKFDVKSDMIIKTEESKKLGAKFLESADALSKVECLHLCCETENCDVFVYEEKGQGECFMFHCGPAQDFRCKFSKHANYTSAIFSIEKKVQPLAIAPKKINVPTVALSQNEIELKSLKGKLPDVKMPPKTNITTPPAKVFETTTKASSKNVTSHCSRFQFQCHSGDCIAVYNACDGIPQCDDGSDEGPECQSITRTPDSQLNKAPAEGRVQLVNNKVQSNENAVIEHNREDPLTAPQWPNLLSPDMVAIHQYTDDASKAVYNRNGGLQITNTAQQVAQLQSDVPRYPVTSKDSYWNSLSDQNVIPNWAQQQMPQFPIKSLQFPPKTTYTQYQPAAVLPDQAQLKNPQQYSMNWPISESNLPNLQNIPILPNLNHPNHNNEEILPEKDTIGVMKDMPVLDRKKDGKNLKSDSKSTEDSDYNNEDEEETTTEPPKKKKKHRKVNKIGKQPPDERAAVKDPSEQQMKIIRSGLQAEFMDHYGAADRPAGAVISLALGILITIGLVMVISCRTTAVRKRIRKGKGYAHDADFLVNGMYL